MQGDAIIFFDSRQINDADSIVVNFNLLFSMSTALIGSVDYYFVNQIINHLCGQFLWIGVLANIDKKLLQILCLCFSVLDQIFKLDNLYFEFFLLLLIFTRKHIKAFCRNSSRYHILVQTLE